MSLLAPREAYRLWAPSYEAGSAVTELERRLVEDMRDRNFGKQRD